jgi:hypothetical protein
VLTNGNSAGGSNINMNNQDILSCDNLQVATINGSAYPPATTIPTLTQVLTAGNTANNSITLTDGSVSNTTNKNSITLTDGTLSTQVLVGSNIITNGAGDTNTVTATSQTITDNASSGNSSYSYNSISINGGAGTFSADTTKMSVENGGDAVFIGTGAGAKPLGVEVTNGGYTLSCVPKLNIDAVSNSLTPIPPLTLVPHQINCKSNLVPPVDLFVATGYSLPSNETYNVFYTDNQGYEYAGCASGNVYQFTGSAWNLVASFDGAVNCFYYLSNEGRLYIGGAFNQQTYPNFVSGLNYFCYASGANFNSVGVPVWSNTGTNGFNAPVLCITGDYNRYLYIGGNFTQAYSSGITCEYIAVYDATGNENLYPLDNQNGYGFNGAVWNLQYSNGLVCATGEFTYITSSAYTGDCKYITALTFSNGFQVSNVNWLFNNPTQFQVPIQKLDYLFTDGGNFFILTNESYGFINYVYVAPYYNFTSPSPTTGNAYTNPQNNGAFLAGQLGSIELGNRYYLQGTLNATLPIYPTRIYKNYQYSRFDFLDLNTGAIYAFAGNNQNRFQLESGRKIVYAGNEYTGGVYIIPPAPSGKGFSALLEWNGTDYELVSGQG